MKNSTTILQCIEANTFNVKALKHYKELYNEDIALKHIPLINLGRGQGHTTAIKQFIMGNPQLKLLIVTPNLQEFANTNFYGKKDNSVNRNNLNIDIDYIIMEANFNKLDINLFINHLKDNCKLIRLNET